MINSVIKDNRGSTLVIITWLFAVTGIITAFLLYRAELEWATVANMERSIQARQLAEEILIERLKLFIEDETESDSVEDSWFNNGYFSFERNGYQITIVIEDEGSKPNLNLLTEEDLTLVGLDKTDLDPILDWIDRDDDLRTEGAELEYYQAQKPAYRPKNGFLTSNRELLALKNGHAIYETLTPYVTVYGKYNPNVLNGETISNLLSSAGFQNNWVERLSNDFIEYRKKERFSSIDDFLKLSSVTLQTRDQLQPLFMFDGKCNINLISEAVLEVMLNNAGYEPQLAKEIIKYRNEQPFTSIEEIGRYVKNKEKNKELGDYFTTVSTIVRYQIWLTNGNKKFYLDTVQERTLGSNRNTKWSVTPLSYVFMINNDVPEIPKYTKNGDNTNE